MLSCKPGSSPSTSPRMRVITFVVPDEYTQVEPGSLWSGHSIAYRAWSSLPTPNSMAITSETSPST